MIPLQALAWRQQIGADKILSEYQPIDVIEKYRTGGIIGFDKEGCPVYIDPYGLVDLKGKGFQVCNWKIKRI